MSPDEHRRTYQCRNRGCRNVGASYEAVPQIEGPFLRWPSLMCVCGSEPMVIETRNGDHVWRTDDVLMS